VGLERRVKKLAHSAKPWVEIVIALAQVIGPFLLFFLGIQFKNAYEKSLEERKLQLANVAEMRTLIRDLSLGSESEPVMRSEAATLAAYGEPAVIPFIRILDTQGGPNQVQVATFGLRALAWRESTSVCRALIRVVEDGSGLFLWQTQRAALQMLTDIRSTEARRAVQAVARDTMLSQADFAKRYRNADNLSVEAYASIKMEVAKYSAHMGAR
jgi:hypothetical protein